MFKRLPAALCALLLCLSLAPSARASNFYIIPDSHTRALTREELWDWQYDALGYILNEIFARHGYHFIPGQKYDSYFRAQTWYHENEQYDDNQDIYEHLMTDVEWRNERLVKEVRAEMRALGTRNPDGKPLPAVSYEPPIDGAFSAFTQMYFAPDQRLKVYSGPGTGYYRAANGKAMASTNGAIYAGGWENGWLMVMYWTNGGNVRVGYASSADFNDRINAPMLHFDYAEASITRRCTLTDDPVATYQALETLSEGTNVTYLSEYVNEARWAYVETTALGQPARGFVPADCVRLADMEEDEAVQL